MGRQGKVVDGVSRYQLRQAHEPIRLLALSPGTARSFREIDGEKAHVLLRRGMFYCHRDFERFWTFSRLRNRFTLYTGRGPSSESMHLGHMVPFVFCQ